MKLALNRSTLILVVAIAIGALAAFSVNRYIRRHVEDIEASLKAGKTVRVVVPKDDLPKGAEIEAKLVAVREVPAEWAHSNAVTPEQFERVEHQKLAYPVTRGEMLLWSLLEGQRAPSFSARLAPGKRAITVPVDEVNSISGMIVPGDRIDLMASARRDNKTYLFAVMQNTPVLATGSRIVPEPEAKDGRRTYTTITIEATPEQAQRVLAARELGKLAAMLRAPGDAAQSSGAKRDAMALLGIGEAGPVSDGSVPVLYGGRVGANNVGRMPVLNTAATTANSDK